MMVVEPKPIKKVPVFTRVQANHKKPRKKLDLPPPNFSRDNLIIYRHKLNPVKWFTNSQKLVIIGFSAVTKAFLRQLVFQWNSKE